jgi:hypothetical protein
MAVIAGPALGQVAPIDRVPVIQPSAGERVRINHGADGAVVTGSWVGIDPYGVRLLATPEDTIQVALDRLVSLERLTGTKRPIGAGALIGSLVGLAIGFAVTPKDESPSNWGMPDYSKFAGAAVGSLIGGAVGALIGASMKTERWETVPLRPAGP